MIMDSHVKIKVSTILMKKNFINGNAWLLIALFIMAALFFSSSQSYQSQSQVSNLSQLLPSHPFTKQLSQVHFSYAGSNVSIEHLGYYRFVEFFLRKFAHFSSYFLLGISLYLGIKNRFNIKQLLPIVAITTWLAATGYASLDELHQMYTSGRSPLFQDVLLDSIGALTGIMIIFLISTLTRHYKK